MVLKEGRGIKNNIVGNVKSIYNNDKYLVRIVNLENYDKYDYKSDMWSVGCILFEMITKKGFLYNLPDNDKTLLENILKHVPIMPDDETFNKYNSKGTKFNIKKRSKKFVAKSAWAL